MGTILCSKLSETKSTAEILHVLARTHGLEPRSRNGWLKWAEYVRDSPTENVFDVSSKFAHRNSGGRANWLGSLFSHKYL